MFRRLFQCLLLCLASSLAAEEPAMEALLKDSPLIVVADPVFENGMIDHGETSEAVLVKYSIEFKVRKILKSDSTVKVGDTILTRLALFFQKPGEGPFQPKQGESFILFLRPTSYEKNSFENTSIWFGVMPHTEMREQRLALDIKETSASARNQ